MLTIQRWSCSAFSYFCCHMPSARDMSASFQRALLLQQLPMGSRHCSFLLLFSLWMPSSTCCMSLLNLNWHIQTTLSMTSTESSICIQVLVSHCHTSSTWWLTASWSVQQNIYLTGFCLFLSLVLMHTFLIVLDLIQTQENYVKLKKAASILVYCCEPPLERMPLRWQPHHKTTLYLLY